MEDARLRTYRRLLTVLVLVGALVATTVGGVLLWRGKAFEGFMALCAVGLFVLIAHGYRQDDEERNRRS
jgi:hypothetical protein